MARVSETTSAKGTSPSTLTRGSDERFKARSSIVREGEGPSASDAAMSGSARSGSRLASTEPKARVSTTVRLENKSSLAATPQAAPSRGQLAAMAAMEASAEALGSSDELDGVQDTTQAARRATRVRRSVRELQRRSAAKANATSTAQGAASGQAATGTSAAASASGATGASGAAGAGAGSSAAGSSGGAAAGGSVGAIVAVILAGIIALVLLSAAIAGGEDDYAGLSEEEALVASLLSAKGLDEVHIAAIMGNWAVESHCNPRQVQHGFGYCRDYDGNGADDCTEQDDYPPELVHNPLCGYGLAQWTYPSRCVELVMFASAQHAHSGEARVQVDFFWHEFSGSLAVFKAIKEVPNATRWFQAVYEGSADGEEGIARRVSEAERIYAALTGTGAGAYVAAAIGIANDDSHGYSMDRRLLNPDVDCSSLVYYALIRGGFDESKLGSYPFSTSNMGPILERAGFKRLPYTGMGSLSYGDILVAPGHTEIYIGDGRNVGAHTDYDGRPGDSSGREVCTGSFWNSGWTDVYRLAA